MPNNDIVLSHLTCYMPTITDYWYTLTTILCCLISQVLNANNVNDKNNNNDNRYDGNCVDNDY